MTERNDQLRRKLLNAPVLPPPEPWFRAHPAPEIGIGGLTGIGFGTDANTHADLILVLSHSGRGVFDCTNGQLLVRDYDEDEAWPEGPELRCAGIGPLSHDRILIAGICGGGLHHVTDDRWTVDAVAPDWPTERVILSAPGVDPISDEAAKGWWQIHREEFFDIRACGFSPSGRTLAIATNGSLILFSRAS